MIVQKIIERYRRKGYDDFWLADFADTHEGGIFFLIIFLQFLVVAIPIVSLGFLLVKLHFMILGTYITSVIPVGIFFSFIFIIPYWGYVGIKDKKKKGETDLRMTYMIHSKISKIWLKVMRHVPVISMGLLVMSLFLAIIQCGFHLMILIVFFINLQLLLVIARPYNKLLSRIMMEAVYYVDWKTHQVVDHFEERYSGYEKWRIPSSEMDFEQFNVWFFRNICQTAFVSVSIGCLAGLICALSSSPLMLAGVIMEEAEIVQPSNDSSSLNETRTLQTQVASNEIEKVLEEEPIEPEVEETFVDEEEESEEILTDEKVEEDVTESKEETVEKNNSNANSFPLNLLDEMPTMSDGTTLHRGVVAYLKEQIPELEGKHVYVEYKISPEGKVVEVDASLVADRELREKIRKSLLSMPNVKPGKKDGKAVYVLTNITVER